MTITAADAAPARSAPVVPTERTMGLGELIYAHRTYIGISQRAMAARLEFDRRDYQRIEQGRNLCPVGFLTKVTELVDLFDSQVDAIVDQAQALHARGSALHIEVDTAPAREWERNVAGRAAVIAAARVEPVTIKLHVQGQERGQR
ncbi:HTH DNA binding protein [Mycobacterium phage 39HC]|uniref:HTH DNA binding protein n=1 Tax=Mycobacterium phage 39HC TaxID=1463809 RepID=UPI0003F1F95B|nr:HTH DNA binding protein [Mycobacterium phage 39HC]AHJ88338.1 HTH binding protein [Mycobacterium phage 39HC]AHJ88438.1 HTH binding protein [Mycobacterium phage 40BC]